MSIPEMTLGEDVDLVINIVDTNNDPADVSGASSIKVALIRTDHSAIVAGPYIAESSYPGADWANGIVVVEVPGDDTEAVVLTKLLSETKIVGGANPGTAFSVVQIKATQGLIDDP